MPEMDRRTQHRKKRLKDLVNGKPFLGNQAAFAAKAKRTRSRISQLMSDSHSFGETAARDLAIELELGEDYFEEGYGQDGGEPAVVEEPMVWPFPNVSYGCPARAGIGP